MFSDLQGGELVNVTGPKYSSDEQQVGLVLYESSLVVYNVTSEDYGQYVCVAYNGLGQDSRIINLDGTSMLLFSV